VEKSFGTEKISIYQCFIFSGASFTDLSLYLCKTILYYDG